jgi:hypothetical protein
MGRSGGAEFGMNGAPEPCGYIGDWEGSMALIGRSDSRSGRSADVGDPGDTCACDEGSIALRVRSSRRVFKIGRNVGADGGVEGIWGGVEGTWVGVGCIWGGVEGTWGGDGVRDCVGGVAGLDGSALSLDCPRLL